MSDPQTRIEQQAAEVKGLLDEATNISRDAAQRAVAGSYTLDDRINTIHVLFNVAVKSYVAILRLFIAGPLTGQPPQTPLPSEKIEITPQSYPRKCSIAMDFQRVGLPSETVPRECCIVLPDEVIEPNEKEIRIALNDYRYVGANYTGKLCLRPTTASAGSQSEEFHTVTIGL